MIDKSIHTGCSLVRLKCASGGREIGGSNPLTPTSLTEAPNKMRSEGEQPFPQQLDKNMSFVGQARQKVVMGGITPIA